MARVVRQPLKGRRRTDRPMQANTEEGSDDSGEREALSLITQVFGSRDTLPITNHEATDLQITALVAITVKLCIQSWYIVITDDTEFVQELREMVTTVLQGVYRRFQTIDLQALTLNELPDLLNDHIRAVEYSTRLSDSNEPFHLLRPHPALTSAENGLVWSQTLVAKVLPLLLDTRDADNPALRVLLSEVVSEIIVYKALYIKMSEPGFIWDAIARSVPTQQPRGQSPVAILPLIWYWIMVSFTFCWRVVHQPVRKEHVDHLAKARIWTLLDTVLQLRQRTPWLYGMGALLQWILLTQTRALSVELDRLLSEIVAGWLSRSHAVSSLLRQTRHSLFPHGSMAPSVSPPSAAEVAQSLDHCSKSIVDALPPWAQRSYFGVSDASQMQQDVKRSLAIFADASINQALIVSLVELVVARLFPELTY